MFWKNFTENCKPQAFPRYFQGKLVGLAEGSYGYIAQKTASKRSEMLGGKNSRKGLSPLLAIIIGLIVTIVAGILLAQLYFSYAATISARPAANIEYSDLVLSDGTGILVIDVKNTGNVPINSIAVYENNTQPKECTVYYGGETAETYTVSGGRVVSVTCTVEDVSPGEAKSYTIVVGFTDGSTQVYAITIRARSA